MELKRKFSIKKLFTVFYVLALAVYLIVGLQPAGATEYEVSGNLMIPSINLNSDVTDLELVEHKLETPDTIVGSYQKYPTKTLLIGHSSTVFENLNEVSLGDVIVYNGEQYKIAKTETLKKTNVDMNRILAPTRENTIIIMTCAGEIIDEKDATHRLIVTAVKVS